MLLKENKSSLHKFDFELCQYIRSNILGQNSGDRFIVALHTQLDLPLQGYLCGDAVDEADPHQQLLLDGDDILAIEESVGDLSDRFGLHWASDESLHRRWVACVYEIRFGLSVQAAEDWSRLSAGFAAHLEQDSLSLEEGIHAAGEWIYETRRYLTAMRRADLLPFPVGLWPTPSNPACTRSALPVAQSGDLGATRHADFDGLLNTPVNRLPESSSNSSSLPLPPDDELSLREAAKELKCDPKTVIRYLEGGLLQWRNAAPPASTRPRYRIKTTSVLELRNSYTVGVHRTTEPEAVRRPPRKRTAKSSNYQPKHMRQRPLK